MVPRKANVRIRVQSLDFRWQFREFLPKGFPRPAGSLTPPAKLPPPHAQHFVPERLQSLLVARYSMILEISANHRLQPPRRFLYFPRPAPLGLVPKFFQVCPPCASDRLPGTH